jgi:hypothetical protein
MELISSEDIVLKSNKRIILIAGESQIILDQSGDIIIKGKEIKIQGATKVNAVN